jgi:preprotein translocase subunit SecG
MNKALIFLLIISSISLAIAATDNGWDSFSDGSEPEEEITPEENARFESDDQLLDRLQEEMDKPSEKPKRIYTDEFYIALLLGILVVIIIIIIGLTFFKKPKSQFGNKK